MADNNELALQEDVKVGFGSIKSFEFTMRAANLLTKSTLVPKDFQGNIPNCIIALNMADRMGADPLMVMQNLYIVHGRPSFSSQFLISTFNSCGRFSSLRYEWEGEKGTETWGCRAWAIEKATGERLNGSSITMAMAKKEGWSTKSGSKWLTMPDQMLMYRAASFFVRAYAPELAMGMSTTEEVFDQGDYIDVTPTDKPLEAPTTLDAEFRQVQETEPAEVLFGGEADGIQTEV